MYVHTHDSMYIIDDGHLPLYERAILRYFSEETRAITRLCLNRTFVDNSLFLLYFCGHFVEVLLFFSVFKYQFLIMYVKIF